MRPLTQKIQVSSPVTGNNIMYSWFSLQLVIIISNINIVVSDYVHLVCVCVCVCVCV